MNQDKNLFLNVKYDFFIYFFVVLKKRELYIYKVYKVM